MNVERAKKFALYFHERMVTGAGRVVVGVVFAHYGRGVLREFAERT